MRTTVFLDANVLAKPFTRTLLLVASAVPSARFHATWSAYAEREGQDHLRVGTLSLSDLRLRHGRDLSATGRDPGRFSATDKKDRQIFADAEAAGAVFLVTGNIQDFGRPDLASSGVSAVHYDLFAARQVTREGYLAALTALSYGRVPLEHIHAAVAQQHPLLFAARRADFPSVEPVETHDGQPFERFRGTSCVQCSRPLVDPESVAHGVGPECRTKDL